MKAISPEEMAVYRRTMQRREVAMQQLLQVRRRAAWAVVRQAASSLREDFQATRVIVFGSLVHQQWFSPTSDIDLAVAGISAWDHLAAVAQMQDLSDFKVDLVRLETCRAELRAEIIGKGKEL